MIDVEALKRWLLFSGLLFTAVGWWRAEMHNAQLAELGDGFHGLARDCIDTSLSRLDGIELKRRELIEALRVGGPEAVAENIDR